VALPVADATAGIALRIIWPRKPSHPTLAFDKVEIPWRGVWPVRLYNIFPNYIINGTVVEKTLLKITCVFLFLANFVCNISYSKKM
jgi:hypothetical protein